MQIEWLNEGIKLIFVSKNAAIAFPCSHLSISVHNDRHFSANGFVTMRPIAMKFARD